MQRSKNPFHINTWWTLKLGRTSMWSSARQLVVLSLLGSIGCKDMIGTAALPAGTQSPESYDTPTGALKMYRGAKALLTVMRDVVTNSGLITDELTYFGLGNSVGSIGATGNLTDERDLDESMSSGDADYNALQELRGRTTEAIGLLSSYAPGSSPALRGEMYALQAYAELLLAELYCSGVPLSTLDFERDFTYKPSSTRDAVLQHAVTLLDSALILSSDSISALSLARVAKGRALLDLAQYAEAGQAVADVPDAFQYAFPIVWNNGANGISYEFETYPVSDHEGINGLPFGTAHDPRARISASGNNSFGVPQFIPDKYPAGSITPVVLASGIEARLIEAEAALAAHDTQTWLQKLNTLRTTCSTVAGCPDPAPAGTGGVEGLAPLSDPGSDSARVTLLFSERAYWLFLTGHRQGDLRRLVRNYQRPQDTVYPTGLYFGGFGQYGSDVNFPVPGTERANALFHGCLDREA